MNLRDRVETNDNRGTAQPYLLLLQEKRTYVGSEEHGHQGQVKFVEMGSGDYATADSEEELKEEIRSWYDGEEPDWDRYNIQRYWEGYYWETVNVFLSDKGYKEHLELNRHNLGEHRTFGIHAFRNPEIREVYNLIKTQESDQNPKV